MAPRSTVAFLLVVLSLISLSVSSAICNGTSYRLRTELKPNQESKAHYNGLYLRSYHTGAGLGDAVLGSTPGDTIGCLTPNPPIETYSPWAPNFQTFDIGNDFPWHMIMGPSNSYQAWTTVQISAAGTPSDGFFINATGLQWSTVSPEPKYLSLEIFGGWFVCDWWYNGVPQLFWKTTYELWGAIDINPSSCADVYLIPEYINSTAYERRSDSHEHESSEL